MAMEGDIRGEQRPYGSWSSPLTASWVAQDNPGNDLPRIFDGTVYWVQKRPAGTGPALMTLRSGQAEEVLAEPWYPGSSVHEVYSGATFTVARAGVYFVNRSDQRLCHLDPSDGAVTPLNSASGLRLVDPVVDEPHGRVIAVAERHGDDHRTPQNLVVGISARGGEPQELVGGADFYSGVRPSPDGAWLCWISWSHPNMPWNGTRLWVAPVSETGAVGEAVLVAGADDVSVACPVWAADGTLWFVSDLTGWWNLYRHRPGSDEEPRILQQIDADCTRPPWEIGHQSYVPTGPDSALVVLRSGGSIELTELTATSRTRIAAEYTEFADLVASGTTAVTVARSSQRTDSIIAIDLNGLSVRELYHDSTSDPDLGYISIAEPVTYPTADGEVSHGYYYSPRNARYTGRAEDRPPLLITVHGGPTSAARPNLNPTIQYFTSRGFAVIDLNYRGSTGFGRAYWERLYGHWGVTDVEDCVYAARYLAAQRGTDLQRGAVRGGSAGGFTALAALAFSDAFQAGVSYYGVSDLDLMEQETHKFESRYTTRLVCGDDDDPALLTKRSPIQSASRINAPVLFLQGAKDPVVPPNQSQLMLDELRSRGVPTAYLEFAEESHGFSKAESTRLSLEAELTFYAEVFGIERDDLVPLDLTSQAPG